jgi:hypothetical protein
MIILEVNSWLVETLLEITRFFLTSEAIIPRHHLITNNKRMPSDILVVMRICYDVRDAKNLRRIKSEVEAATTLFPEILGLLFFVGSFLCSRTEYYVQ